MLVKILDYQSKFALLIFQCTSLYSRIKLRKRIFFFADNYQSTCKSFGSASRYTTIFSREPPRTIRSGWCTSARKLAPKTDRVRSQKRSHPIYYIQDHCTGLLQARVTSARASDEFFACAIDCRDLIDLPVS